MPDQPPIVDHTGASTPAFQRSGRLRRAFASAIGLILLAAALIMVASRHDMLSEALRAIGAHSRGKTIALIAAMLATVFVNIALSGAMFSVLMSRYATRAGVRVGVGEMQALIASATLINYLPLTGVIGRTTYHKVINGIPVRDSVKTVVQAVTCSAAVTLCMVPVVVILRQQMLAPWIVVGVPVVALAALAFVVPGAFVCAAAIRLVDALVTALRYYIAFSLIGQPVEFASAIAFACLSMMTTVVPFSSNGLGLREWAVGLLTPTIAAYPMEMGMAADLLNRASELVIVTLAGVPATLWLARRVGESRASRSDMLR